MIKTGFPEQLLTIPDLTVRFNRYLESMNGSVVSAADPDVMILADYDPVTAGDLLRAWAEKNDSSCTVLSDYPLRIKIYGKDPADAQNRFAHTNHKRKVEYAVRKKRERMEWDQL